MDSEDAIEREYKRGNLESIDAIGRLEKLGKKPKEAEALVDQWDEEEENEE
jgi:hypothetical protein